MVSKLCRNHLRFPETSSRWTDSTLVTHLTLRRLIGNCLTQRVARTRIRNACDQHLSFFEIGSSNVCNTMFGDNDVNIALRRSDVAAGNARHDATFIAALSGRWQGKDRQAAG